MNFCSGKAPCSSYPVASSTARRRHPSRNDTGGLIASLPSRNNRRAHRERCQRSRDNLWWRERPHISRRVRPPESVLPFWSHRRWSGRRLLSLGLRGRFAGDPVIVSLTLRNSVALRHLAATSHAAAASCPRTFRSRLEMGPLG